MFTVCKDIDCSDSRYGFQGEKHAYIPWLKYIGQLVYNNVHLSTLRLVGNSFGYHTTGLKLNFF